jgi:GT2 family glycosyltransferase
VLVSVIIPVYNDAERLNDCLARLALQTYSPFEIIVVDNGSDNVAGVEAVVAAYPFASLQSEAMPGSYAARNRGIEVAKGEILAFTDADCLPAVDWLAQGVQEMQANLNCGLVAGAIAIVMQTPHHPVELYESVMGLAQETFVRQHHYGATANLFTWPAVFDKVGRFNATLNSSGDVEWGQRVFAAGYAQHYVASARIEHPARRSFAELAQQASRHAGGFYKVRCQQQPTWLGRNAAYLKLLAFHLMPPVRFARTMAQHPQLADAGQVAKVVLTLAFVRLMVAKALLSLKFGGVAAR